VLDASALLALLHDEAGAEAVEAALRDGASVSAVNWAEVLTKLADDGAGPDRSKSELEDLGLLGSAIVIHPLDEELAGRIAALRRPTRAAGLSLGDRACLALAQALGAVALTSDQSWSGLRVGVEVRVIR
jgi:PIN domain nuclease of toxin-antitoxin system